MTLRCALVLAAACGSHDVASPPASSPAAPAAVAAAPQLDASQRAALATQAKRLAAVAEHLGDAKQLDDGATAIGALHATTRWQHAQARERYKVVDGSTLVTARRRMRELAAAMEKTAHALDTAQTSAAIADAMQTASAAFDAAIRGGLGGLSSDVVDELVYDRDHVCAKPGEPACAALPAIEAAFQYLHDEVPRAAADLRGVATDLDRALDGLHDTHLHVVLSRVAGTGPSFGEPCGPEQLCRWDQACMPATNTCEHTCFEGAMDPCPGAYACKAVAGLSGMFCRK